jgi:hypothetical protein
MKLNSDSECTAYKTAFRCTARQDRRENKKKLNIMYIRYIVDNKVLEDTVQ